ncbi:protein FAR1-RELATED SEQUENCE 5-like [Silene latifolia]|uniref:protein FAR1-RELATED SEQUENCE 5-like n=1 Tax=Silene latifolia TaxID=37657 RepID=UPI003D76FCF2
MDACNVYIESRYFDDEDVVKIMQCHLEHNHEMDPKKSRLFVGFRHINDYFKKRMMINDAAGISILNNYKSLVFEGVGHENLGFKFSDSRNAINQERRSSVIDGDAKELKAYFEKMKEEDPNYFYAIELDDFEAPMNIFWYRMPFSPFIGVNQYGNSIVFACALVTRDYEESFEWVFAKFLECMGKAPSVIFDQERAIGNAIKKSSPTLTTGSPLAHIEKSLVKMGKHPLWNDISSDLNLAVHDSLEVHDFEIAWKEMVFHKLYTKKIYKLVRDEVIGLIYTNADPPRRLGHSVTFNVENKKVAPFGKCKNYWVDINRSVGLLKCSCKLFEFKGILCRHIIRCMVIEDVKVIPKKYILDRWRKDLVREYETIETGYYNPEASARAKKSLEELEGIVGVKTIDAYVPGGVSSRVWGHRRLQPKECNIRYMKRKAAQREGGLQDPVDRRRSGRVPKGNRTPDARKNKKKKTSSNPIHR